MTLSSVNQYQELGRGTLKMAPYILSCFTLNLYSMIGKKENDILEYKGDQYYSSTQHYVVAPNTAQCKPPSIIDTQSLTDAVKNP